LFVGIVAPSGEGKTPFFGFIRAPFDAADRRRGNLPSVTEVRVLNRERQRLEGQAARASTREERAELIDAAAAKADQIAEATARPPRKTMSDVTSERLADLLADNDGRMFLLSDEGDELFGGLRRRGAGSGYEVILRGYSGGAPIQHDRVSRPDVIAEDPTLSITVGIQPGPLARALDVPEFHSKGLFARFLFVVPRSLQGQRVQRRDGLDEAVLVTYERVVRGLLALRVRHQRADPGPSLLTLDGAAVEVFANFSAEIDRSLASDGESAPIRAWSNKLRGATARVAGILHLSDYAAHGTDAIPATIPSSTVDRAIVLARFFAEHARIVFAGIGDPSEADARRVLRWIRSTKRHRFTTREAVVHTNGSLPGPRVERGLARLTADGWLRAVDVPYKGNGRPAKPEYVVNPHLWDD